MISVRDADEQRRFWNASRFDPQTTAGHYESWFQRANHPTRPLAFWIRYTIFCPRGRPDDAIGELWAVFFDGERGRTIAVKEELPISQCRFSRETLDVTIGAATMDEASLRGCCSSNGRRIGWTLAYGHGEAPLLLLPRALYAKSLPRAKALTGMPNARFDGTLEVDGETVLVDGWRGSQNHNWGSRHTDSYAWGQVAGFDGADDVFLECSTAQLRFGPFWTPRMSLVVVRAGRDEIALNALSTSLRSKGRFGCFDWRIEAANESARVVVTMEAPREAFVGLAYRNPPGGTKTCLNTKLATCTLRVERPAGERLEWSTRHRAAFEILTDRSDHGIDVVA